MSFKIVAAATTAAAVPLFLLLHVALSRDLGQRLRESSWLELAPKITGAPLTCSGIDGAQEREPTKRTHAPPSDPIRGTTIGRAPARPA